MIVKLSVEEGVGVISLANAPANSFNVEFLHALQAVLREVRESREIRVVIIRSDVTKFFSAGGDVSTLSRSEGSAFEHYLHLANEVADMVTHMPKLFLAAIAGHCIGGGLELALACDFRYACAGSYRIGLGEINLGIAPGMGGTQRLPRLIRTSAALRMMVTGEMVSPGEALTLGIVDQVFEADHFVSAVMNFAKKLAKGPTLAQGRIKLSVNLGLEGNLSQGLAIERTNLCQLIESRDASEGLRAFLDKRAPVFTGN